MNKKFLIGTAFLLFLLIIVSLFMFISGQQTVAPKLNQEDAIVAVIEEHPELALYKTASLPPSSIKAEQQGDGWYVGFIQSGSGLPGILTATCYYVSNAKAITPTGVFSKQGVTEMRTVESIQLETCTPVYFGEPAPVPDPATPATATPPESEDVLTYGKVTLKLNERAMFKDLSIRPVAIVEDSRCPSDVQCIWAGQVRVKVEVISAMGKSEGVLTQGVPFTTEVEVITLTDVMPAEKHSQREIPEGDYRFTFNVALR